MNIQWVNSKVTSTKAWAKKYSSAQEQNLLDYFNNSIISFPICSNFCTCGALYVKTIFFSLKYVIILLSPFPTISISSFPYIVLSPEVIIYALHQQAHLLSLLVGFSRWDIFLVSLLISSSSCKPLRL